MAGNARQIGTARRGLGTFTYEATTDPVTFIVRVQGVDGPVLLKQALEAAEAFGRDHPEGWVWITDARRLLWTSPRGLRYVRKVRDLPNNRGYAVIARLLFRGVGNVLGRTYGAETFVATEEEALAFAADRLSSSAAPD